MKKIIAFLITVTICSTSYTYIKADPLNTNGQSSSENELKQSEAALNQVEKSLSELESDIEKLDNEIGNKLNDIEINKESIKKSELAIKGAIQDVLTAEADLQKQQDLLDERIRAMYKSGNGNYLNIILNSDSLTDLVSNSESVYRMISFDKEIADELELKRTTLIEKQTVLETEKENLVALQTENETKLSKLTLDKENQSKLISQLEQKQSALSEEVANDKAAVSVAVSSIINQAITIATSTSSSTEDIKIAIAYLEKTSKTTAISNAITKGKSIITSRTTPAPSTNSTKTDRGTSSTSAGTATTKTTNTTKTTTPSTGTSGVAIALYAQKFLGIDYLWGGSNPTTGFDCSGLVQYCYKNFGISISRTCATQIKNDGRFVDKSELAPGDLIYFGTWDNPHHVGMYIGNGCFIHAPRTGDVVKIQSLSVRSDFLAAKRILK